MKYTILFALVLFSSNSFAMFCPTNFTSIDIGDTIEKVEQQCGKADSQATKTVSPTGLPQEWGFYQAPPGSPETTLKVTVAFDKDKVINISVNGQSMQTTEICGAAISIGDTSSSVKSACGKPSYINKGEQQGAPAGEKKLTELKYGAVTLVFEDGKLKARK